MDYIKKEATLVNDFSGLDANLNDSVKKQKGGLI